MSFVISCVLACATILATFMLQLADDDLNSNSSVIGVISLVAILSALYLVDYRKKFALSKTACNVLLLLAVAVQFGALTHSSHEILAFAIANILASLQAILFFQSKTLRKCYQILFISFVEVAVGCVFQRSAFFVAALPVYAILSFLCFSLLFLWGERKFYTERVVLKNRFSGNKNLQLISAEEPIHQLEEKPLDSFDSAAALAYGKRARLEDSSRFFRRPSIPALHFGIGYFKRFIVGALTAFVFASFFFGVFPRMDRFGFGFLTFDNISWGGSQGAGVTKTGFSPKIELGDLGPSLDSHETVMTVDFVDCADASNALPLDPLSPVYFRGMPLPSYKDRSWLDLHSSDYVLNVPDLRERIATRTVTNPDFILSHLYNYRNRRANASSSDPLFVQDDGSQTKLSENPPQILFQYLPHRFTNDPNYTPYSPRSGGRQTSTNEMRDPAASEMVRTPHSGGLVRTLPIASKLGDFEEIGTLADLVSKKVVDVSQLGYDSRNSVVGYDVTLKPLDTNITFFPAASYVAKSFPDLAETSAYTINLIVNHSQASGPRGGRFYLFSTSVRNRRQTALTPNQERVWPFLAEYLEIDQTRFPQLIRQARAWDKESGYPQQNLIARARYIESRLRDSGGFKYNRSGVIRDPKVDPLEDFVSEHKEGHCEYFAGALALMLRAVGIPSRVVVGFACYPDANGKPTTVRQSDAHSWVEAYIPPDKFPEPGDVDSDLFAGSALDGAGNNYLPDYNDEWPADGAWLRLDATPASDRDSDRPDALTLGIYTWSNLFRSFGRDFVLNFNAAQQMRNVYAPLLEIWRRFVAAVQSVKGTFALIETLFEQGKNTIMEMISGNWTPVVVLRFSILIAFILAVVGVGRRAYKYFKGRIEAMRKAAELSAKKAKRSGPAALFYLRLEKAFETKLGVKRKDAETPREFIERCFIVENELERQNASQGNNANASSSAKEQFKATPESTRKLFRELVEKYYQEQFGAQSLADRDVEKWSRVLKDEQIA